MENSGDVREYIRRKASREIIIKHLFLESIESRYSDEYIETMYRISPLKIRSLYDALNENEKIEMEEEIKKQIATGDIDIKKEVIQWHRESLSAKHRREINKENRNKQGKEH